MEVFDERLSDSSIGTALELMVLADAYIVPNLKEQCEVYLKVLLKPAPSHPTPR